MFGVVVIICYVDEWPYEKARRAARQLAKEVEIEEGVTLEEGLRAYFGKGVTWLGGNDLVLVWAANPKADYPTASLRVNTKTGQVTVERFNRGNGEEPEPEVLIDLLIQAAKHGKENPKA